MKHLSSEDSPTRRVVRARVPHGVKPEIVVSVYPGGEIGLREQGRRDEYKLDAGVLYVNALLSTARQIESKARKIKKEQGISLPAARKKAKAELLK